MQNDKAKPAREPQSEVAIKPEGFRPVEQVDLLTGWQQIVTGTWAGVGLLKTLPEQQVVWGQQVLIVEPGKDRHRLQTAYPETMIFKPAEFLDVVEGWPESEGLIRAKRAFNGHVAGGAA